MRRYFYLGLLCVIGLLGFRICPDLLLMYARTSVRFVVPNGHRGLFCVRETTLGESVRRDDEGLYVLDIPQSGELAIRDGSIFRVTNVSAETVGGRKFPPIKWPPAPPFEPGVGIAGVSVTSKGEYYFLIGTEKELYDYRQWSTQRNRRRRRIGRRGRYPPFHREHPGIVW